MARYVVNRRISTFPTGRKRFYNSRCKFPTRRKGAASLAGCHPRRGGGLWAYDGCAFRTLWCGNTRTSSYARWSMPSGRGWKRPGSDPSPPRQAKRGAPCPRPLVRARGAGHPPPGERENRVPGCPHAPTCAAGGPQEKAQSFSAGRRWTATEVLISRRGQDEGSLPPTR